MLIVNGSEILIYDGMLELGVGINPTSIQAGLSRFGCLTQVCQHGRATDVFAGFAELLPNVRLA